MPRSGNKLQMQHSMNSTQYGKGYFLKFISCLWMFPQKCFLNKLFCSKFIGESYRSGCDWRYTAACILQLIKTCRSFET